MYIKGILLPFSADIVLLLSKTNSLFLNTVEGSECLNLSTAFLPFLALSSSLKSVIKLILGSKVVEADSSWNPKETLLLTTAVLVLIVSDSCCLSVKLGPLNSCVSPTGIETVESALTTKFLFLRLLRICLLFIIS
jgi:hypothetical protein